MRESYVLGFYGPPKGFAIISGQFSSSNAEGYGCKHDQIVQVLPDYIIITSRRASLVVAIDLS